MKVRLKRLRKTLGLTLVELGEKLGVSITTISFWENGRNDIPEPIRLLICLLFNVNREWLETGRGEMFIEAKSPAQLDAEVFERVALQMYDSLPDEYKTTIGAVAREIAGKNATPIEAGRKTVKRGRPPKESR